MAGKRVSDSAKTTALDKALRAMFGALRGRPVPEPLLSVVDQLDAAEAPPRKQSRRA